MTISRKYVLMQELEQKELSLEQERAHVQAKEAVLCCKMDCLGRFELYLSYQWAGESHFWSNIKNQIKIDLFIHSPKIIESLK